MTRHEQDHRIESDERLALRQREQLSAFADGGLPAEQARFLLRRLAHDDALAGCLERWQLAGDAMRGTAVHAVRGDALRARVAAAVAEVPVAPRARAGWGWPRVAGLAAAASVAAIALVLVRPSLEPAASGEAPAIATSIAAPGLPDAGPAPLPASAPPPVRPAAEVANVPQFADLEPVEPALPAVAPARAPVVLAAQDATPGPLPGIPAVPPPAAAADAPDAATVLAASDDPSPFGVPAEPRARPWPRAELPGLQPPGYTVGFDDTPAPSFHPFEPRLPEDPEP